MKKVNERISENCRITISEHSVHFPESSGSLLHKIVTDKLGYHKFCAHCEQKKRLSTFAGRIFYAEGISKTFDMTSARICMEII